MALYAPRILKEKTGWVSSRFRRIVLPSSCIKIYVNAKCVRDRRHNYLKQTIFIYKQTFKEYNTTIVSTTTINNI